jgi:two-component system CheB/CheR fusion protein
VGAYLQIPGGTLTHNLHRLARPPLRDPLLTALAAARRQDGFVSAPVSVGGRRVRVRTELLPATSVARPLMLVVFEELPADDAGRGSVPASVAGRVQELEAEVAEAHRQLAALLAEQHEAESGASARPRFEELQMSAVLEECRTSKEELQSINEELLTLDADNRQRMADLKRLSTDLQHLLHSTGIAMIFLDRQQRIVRYNPQARELFRIQPDDVGRPLSDLYTSLLYRELAEDTHRVLSTGAPVEREVPEREGRWFMVRLHPYRTPETIDGVVLTLVDVTARKRAELAVRDVDRRKDEFLAVLAHELRNPLAPISAGVEVLKRSGDDPRTVASVAAMMDRQSRQLVRLVDDLLDAARIAGGRLQLRLGPVDIATVVKDATAMVAPLIERGRQTLTVDVSDEPMVVQADAARLTQVIANILTNAANYTPPEGRIALTVTPAGAAVVLTISDTGQGMSPDVLEHLFDMYFQGSASPQVRTKGLGIGLAIAKQLVEMQGGAIAASSNGAGAGSVFTVSLPLLPDASLLLREDEGVPVHQASRRVLVVDDNADAAQSLSLLLATMAGIVVRTALSGRDALEVGADFKPQVVLLDLGMPGMDGYEVARLVRGTPWGKDAMLVAVTGWGQSEHRERAKAAGIDEHLTKPVRSETLEAILIESEHRTNDRP